MYVRRRQVYDAIVVGSGISGGWAAKELAEKGMKVLVLERGRAIEHGKYPTEYRDPWDFDQRGMGVKYSYEKEYPVQSRDGSFNESTAHWFVSDREQPYEVAEGTAFRWIRGYHLGGRSLKWGRQCYRWSDLDFEANLRDGHGVDWPIRYAEIAPWYSYVERFVGISGRPEGLPYLPDGEFLPPMELNCGELHLKSNIERAFPGRKLTIGRVANLTQAIHGRGPCQYRNECSRGCSFAGYFSSVSSTLPAAQKTGNVTIVTDAIVESVLYDEERDRATGVRVIDRNTKQEREYLGRIVFLCASTLGTAAIMLNSRSRRFPNGIANGSGELGHNLMDHIFQAGANADIPGNEDMYYYGRRPTGFYLPRFHNLRGSDSDAGKVGFVRGYGYQGGAYRASWARGAGMPGLGADLKKTLRQPGTWQLWMTAFGECLPRHENHVALDATQKDAWGMPLLRINCKWSDNERAMMLDSATQAANMLEAAGCTNISTYNNMPPPGECIHEMGTARMGRDPRTSVLNAHNQAHEVPNLFVTDGACMTSSANQNPSITYMALTARACDYAVSQTKAGAL
jgi:choline dehydrogenase-like flavoprotein